MWQHVESRKIEANHDKNDSFWGVERILIGINVIVHFFVTQVANIYCLHHLYFGDESVTKA